jgi:hypothetical protein
MRLVVLSGRHLGQEIYWRNCGPPLEDALASFSDATLVLPPPLRNALRPGGRPAWLNAIRTLRKADAVFWPQMHLRPVTPVWASAYVQPMARRGTLAMDAWEPTIENLGRILTAQHLFTAWVHYSEAYDWLRAHHPRLRLSWLRLGFNQGVFRDLEVERDIYALWVGRRLEPLHQALIEYCAARGLVYRYSRAANDPATTEELNELVSRARYFLVTPPNLSNTSRTGSYSPLTMRYIEGPASGSRLLGVAPRRVELDAHLPVGALIEVQPDGTDLADVLERSDQDAEFEATRIAVREHVLKHHSWVARAAEIHRAMTDEAAA